MTSGSKSRTAAAKSLSSERTKQSATCPCFFRTEESTLMPSNSWQVVTMKAMRAMGGDPQDTPGGRAAGRPSALLLELDLGQRDEALRSPGGLRALVLARDLLGPLHVRVLERLLLRDV